MNNIEFYASKIEIINEEPEQKKFEIRVGTNRIKKEGLIVIIDGTKNVNAEQYLATIYERLDMPYPEYKNWNGYMDWMRDLSWIEDRNIVIIIKDYDYFLSQEPQFKEYFIIDFIEYFFPYWEKYAENPLEDSRYAKNITVVCENCSNASLPKCPFCGAATKWAHYKDSMGGSSAVVCFQCRQKQPYPSYTTRSPEEIARLREIVLNNRKRGLRD